MTAKYNFSKNIILIFIIFVFSVIAAWPLTKPGLYQIHDDQQIARLYLYDQSLKSGQFPVRWIDGLGFGFGYPLYVFYPPLVYMLGELYHLIGLSYINSVKLVFFSSILFSGIAIYIFSKEIWGKLPALITALFYMFIPYRALDVYVRGALAESFSFVWPPIILWSIVYSFCLSAFFWIPALLEKKYTIVDQLLLVNLANYKIHFVYLQQLWDWTWGFGGSAEGLTDGISFKIGKLHVLLSIAALILTIIHLLKNKIKLSVVSCQLSVVFFALFLLSAFMTTFYSKFIWDLFTPMSYIQFPWRFLIFTALFSSILAGVFIYLLRLTIVRLIVGSCLILLLIIPNIKLFTPQMYRSNLTDNIATANELINWDVSKTSYEYLPKGINLYKDDIGNNMVNLTKKDIPRQKIDIIYGNPQISNLTSQSDKISFQVKAKKQSKLQEKIFNFPGWNVFLNNNKVRIDDNNRLRLITFNVPQGNHDVRIEFKNTTVRKTANFITLVSIVFLLILVSNKVRTRSGKKEVKIRKI